MDSQTVAEAIALARQLAAECVVNIESLDRWLTDRVDPRFTTETGRLFQPDVIGPLNTLQSAPVTKLMIHADTLAIDTMRPALQKRLGARVVWIRTDPDLLQAINPAAGKWAAIRTIALANGVAFRDVLAIGDNENDVEMLSEAGIGVAMTSGTDEAKRAADWIAPSNVDDGVAIALDRFVNVD
jgi:5-amino-6-(5-phospho-D-ribitylamino)uracil phosphatase